MESLSGSYIKGYELKERIGAGGFGAVYRAHQSTVGREVAIKIILPGYANHPDFIRRFESEARMVARLEHMHITPLYDFWRDPEGAYFVMRLMQGGSLSAALRREPYDLEAAAVLLDQIASALSVAHRKGIIHRDIKPSNILLDEDGNAYLADFGIAKDLGGGEGVTEADAVVGSPDYLAPEQARKEDVTPHTDIYSLGVVLYEMLTGEHPFPDQPPVARLFKHLNDPLPEVTTLDEDVTGSINEVIQRATEKNPEMRYKDVLAMAAAFREAAGLSPSQVAKSLVELLTPREQEVLQLIIDRKTNREIAEALSIELTTVKWYVRQIYKKLKVRSRVQAIVRARELNLIVDGDLVIPETDTSITGLPDLENPYKGLRAFQAADEQDFFGREAITKKLLQRMSENSDFDRFLAVVGPSGSGKSSLVKAGLIPALWRGDMPGSERWYVVDMIPGSRPLDELEVALTRITSDQSERLNEHLRRDSHGLIRLSKIILPDDGSELVIVIDQFEELFSLVEEEQERSHFLDSLYAAVTDPRSRVRVVITLRADFYDRPLNYADFGQLVQNRTETVLPLSAEELERAIVQPAKRVGLNFEEGLVPAIIQDVHYQPGALPLLQYALTELFDERTNRTMTQEAYKVIGGTIGALATRAEEIYGDLDEDSQESTRQMFLRLVTLGEGVEDTRRRVERSEIMAIVGEEGRDAMDELIDNFAAYRLLSLDNDPTTRSPTIEVAHEALLREWDRLRVWLDESRVDIRLERQLAASAEQWLDAGRDPSFLLRGTRLAQFENWSQHSSLVLTAEEWEFLRDSSQSAVDEEREKDAQVERELAAAQTIRRRAVYLTIALIATAVLAIAAITFARNATNNAARAEAAEESALRQASIGLAALAEAELGGINKERGVLLALEALEHYPYTPQAAGALARSVEEFRAFRSLDASSSVGELIMVATWSPDGTRVAAGSNASPNSIIIWDAATGSELLAVDTHANHCEASRVLLRDLAWSPTGDRLAAAAQNADSGQPCGVVVIDTSTGDELFVLDGYETAARSQDWSPDGNLMVTGHEDGSLRMWQVTSGRERSILTGHSEAIYDAVFSPNGQRIASASEDGTVKLWDADTGVELMVFEGHVGSVRSIDWSPDGKRFVTGGSDGLPRVWEAQSGETVFVLPGHTDEIAIVNWSTDGRRIASQSYDATVNVWDAATGGLIFQITNAAPDPDTKRGFVEFSPDGKWILTGGSRVIGVLLWDATTSVPKLFGHSFGQEWGAWSPDGSLIATSGTDGSARLWDAQSGEQLEVFDHGSFWGDWSPDGTRLVTADGVIAKALSVWDVTTGKLLFSLSVPDDEHGAHQFLTMDWSPDGRYIAAADFRPFSPQAVFVWDVETRELVSAFFPDDLCMQGWPRWSPDSTQIASGCIFVESGTNTPARIWDVVTGVEVLRLESEHGWTYRTVWSPDGSQILVTYENGVARIWDATDGAPRLTFTGHQGPVDGAWSPDGTLIASTDYADQLVKIWKSETGEELWSFSVAGAPLTIGWSPDGAHVIVTGDGLTEPVIKRVWQTTEELNDYAYQCCVYRELSAEEREQFGLPPAEDLARD